MVVAVCRHQTRQRESLVVMGTAACQFTDRPVRRFAGGEYVVACCAQALREQHGDGRLADTAGPVDHNEPPWASCHAATCRACCSRERSARCRRTCSTGTPPNWMPTEKLNSS